MSIKERVKRKRKIYNCNMRKDDKIIINALESLRKIRGFAFIDEREKNEPEP